MPKQPVVLIIRDGWGINPGGKRNAQKNGDATMLAEAPFHKTLYDTYPMSKVSASGEDVGLPDGQMGNSEVGHLNLGAGRVVYQDLTRINRCIESGQLGNNEVLKKALARVAGSGRRLHLLGLLSDGGVHSHQDHLIALARTAHEAGVSDIMVHAITDGRDTSPTGGAGYLSYVEDELAQVNARVATVVGRYFAMDRDERWDRTKLAWDAIINGQGEALDILASDALKDCYAKDMTDEFIKPMVFFEPNRRRIRDGDAVLFFNFRADRARQLCRAFLTPRFRKFSTGGRPKTHFLTLTEYDETYDCPAVFPPEEIDDVLGKVVSKAGKKQLRIAETEKYPHVTYFFNGGVEKQFEGEDRCIIPSPKDVPTYDFKPQMSAPEVTRNVLEKLPEYDMVILNFANPDMVGHTGVVEAGTKAVETIDDSVRQVIERTLELDGKLIITADHGNCEQMRNPDGSPHTAHTTNLVHCLYVGNDHERWSMRDGILADIAPTLLDLLGVEAPDLMTGKSLRVKK